MITAMVLALVLAAALGMLRFLRGPSDADRVIALDIPFATAIGLCVAAALASGRLLFLDMAIDLALVSFVATVARARMIESRADAERRLLDHGRLDLDHAGLRRAAGRSRRTVPLGRRSIRASDLGFVATNRAVAPLPASFWHRFYRCIFSEYSTCWMLSISLDWSRSLFWGSPGTEFLRRSHAQVHHR